MSDNANFGFGKFVPGFEFLQSLASNAVKGATQGIPQLPNMSNWVAPTLSVEDLEKRIEELKAVQFWLDQNAVALKATIQALEVQKMTLATLKGMNFSMGDVANAFKLKTADTVMSGVQKAADTVSGAAGAVAGAAARVTGRAAAEEAPHETDAEPASAAKAQPKAKGKAAGESAVVDPMQWWGALTSQFQQIAANAMKDAAKQTAIDTTKNMATGLAKEALKTATGMASQFAAKGMQTMQGGAKRAAASSAGAAKTTAAAKKPAARKTTPKPAAKKASSTRSPAARKRAG